MQNPLHAYLDSIGLPWQLPRAALVDRYGIKQHAAYSWDVIEIETPQPIVRGLLWPLSVQAFPQFSPTMPATSFSGVAYVCEDACENLRLAVNHLMPALGKGEAIGSSNSLGHKWSFDSASVDLLVWPPDMQRGTSTNPAHELEPRLKAGCYIGVNTGFRAQATAVERDRIESFERIDRIPRNRSEMLSADFLRVSQHELEFVRQPEENFSHCRGWIGLSSDQSTLIFWNHELFVVPMQDVLQFQVTRILPAKGKGGSWFEVKCRCTYLGLETKTLTICTAVGPDMLNDLAAKISNATGKPLLLQPYEYDVSFDDR